MNKELVFLRTFATVTSIGFLALTAMSFLDGKNKRFTEIDVERINIIEKDGTIKMAITNVERFPAGKDQINGKPTNEDRKRRSGMLFFNEDGIECGGFIYDGKKNENGHSAGLSLTYDQYDGDQVMQLITEDYKENDKRFVTSVLAFNDRAANESQLKTSAIMKELEELKIKNPEQADLKYNEYQEKGLIGSAPRILLGKTRSQNNGLFLFDDKGMPKAMFYVDKENKAKLDFFDDNGNIITSFPEKK
jgi:hypothetical protein